METIVPKMHLKLANAVSQSEKFPQNLSKCGQKSST